MSTETSCGWEIGVLLQSINQSILFAHKTSSNETAGASKRDEQDNQAPGALMAALI